MFVGHYGPAGALAGARVKLWHAVIAVQFLDILWAPFVLTGVEGVRIVPNFTEANHLDLYHMPWTHSLPMAAFWSAAAGLAYGVVRKGAGAAGGLIIAALVFSHWLTDFIMHKPDLLLWFGGEKVGLGLWDNRPLSFGLEVALFLGGMAFFLVRCPGRGRQSGLAAGAFLIVGVALQVFGNFGPPPPSVNAVASSALIAYGLFALLAAGVDATRRR